MAKLTKLIEKNLGFRLYRRMLIQENKWRAVRWGLDGKMIDFGKQKEVPTRDLILELLDFVDDVVDELGRAKRSSTSTRFSSGALPPKNNCASLSETKDLNAVVDRLIELTMENVPVTTDFSIPAASDNRFNYLEVTSSRTVRASG